MEPFLAQKDIVPKTTNNIKQPEVERNVLKKSDKEKTTAMEKTNKQTKIRKATLYHCT